MPTKQYLESAKNDFEKTIQHLKDEYSKLQIGRANASLVEDLMVEAYGTKQPLKAVASISIPDPKSIVLQPWDKGNLSNIETAVLESGLNLTPVNDGNVVRINIPQLTEERREELKKLVSKLAEDARISVRNTRQEAHEAFKKLENDKEIGEDEFHRANKLLQEAVDEANEKIEEIANSKEKDIMTV